MLPEREMADRQGYAADYFASAILPVRLAHQARHRPAPPCMRRGWRCPWPQDLGAEDERRGYHRLGGGARRGELLDAVRILLDDTAYPHADTDRIGPVTCEGSQYNFVLNPPTAIPALAATRWPGASNGRNGEGARREGGEPKREQQTLDSVDPARVDDTIIVDARIALGRVSLGRVDVHVYFVSANACSSCSCVYVYALGL